MASGRSVVATTRIAPTSNQAPDARISTRSEAVAAMQERRRRRRVRVAPMYTQAVVRMLSRKDAIIEGHVVDLSETGIAVVLDSLVPVGQPVTVEFRISGLGRVREDQWCELVAAAEVVRQDGVEDFPGGPYLLALRFVRISTMNRAQIARFVATHPG